jgi:hypothetical protein
LSTPLPLQNPVGKKVLKSSCSVLLLLFLLSSAKITINCIGAEERKKGREIMSR